MPLLDHFHPPLSLERHWESFHSAWAAETARLLNLELLPEGYFAEPNVRLSGGIEIDLAALQQHAPGRPSSGGVGTALWAPPAPAVTLPIQAKNAETFEVRVLRTEGGPQVVAAIELVSPANKDRPAHRKAFAVKCAAYLLERVSLIVVDPVTTRRESLLPGILQALGAEPGGVDPPAHALSASACRTVESGGGLRVELWPGELALGRPLPVLPLWLGEDLAVRLDLERSYTSACAALRIPAA